MHASLSKVLKFDALFDWKSLADAGIGYWPRGERVASVFNPNAIKVWQTKFKELGYGVQVTGKFDLDTKAVVTAFQRHWLPENISGKSVSKMEDLKPLPLPLVTTSPSIKFIDGLPKKSATK